MQLWSLCRTTMAPMLIMFVEFGAKQYCAEMVFFALNGVKWFVLGNV